MMGQENVFHGALKECMAFKFAIFYYIHRGSTWKDGEGERWKMKSMQITCFDLA